MTAPTTQCPPITRPAGILESVFRFHVENSFVRTFLRSDQKYDRGQGIACEMTLLPGEVVDEILNMKVQESKVYFLVLVPLAYAAWSQDTNNALQSGRILQCVHDRGIPVDSPASELFRSWLNARPEHSLFQVWSDYVGALRLVMSESGFAALQDAIVSTCTAIIQCSDSLGLISDCDADCWAVNRIQAAFA